MSARLDVAVSTLLPDLSRSRATRLVRDGSVRVDGEVVTRPAGTVRTGAQLEVTLPPPAPVGTVAQDLPLTIVYEDEHVVVVDKAAGMVVHPGAGHPDGTLVNALLHHVDDLSGIGGEERPGIVHRLDRGTSGLLVVAKHDQAHRALSAQFADHSAGRTYLALALGQPRAEHGTISSHLARHPKDRLRFASSRDGQGRHAVTHWWVEGRARDVTLVRCQLETGRTHQIRVHLSEQGWPLAGDTLYARKKARPRDGWIDEHLAEGRVLLHAWTLRFKHPATGEACVFRSPLHEDFVAVLAAAGLREPTHEGLREPTHEG